MRPFITQSELLPSQDRETLATHELVEAAGRPLMVFRQNGWDSYYNECQVEPRRVLLTTSVQLVAIPDAGHLHIEPCFRGTYITLSGIHVPSGDEYVFGMRPELGFSFEPVHIDAVTAWREIDDTIALETSE
ncbi:hypothetical protein KA047_02215 [Candidatus Saccharibacteria bacterium]|nr:hypothetical protein [Candidatus Saccharibacteria bacterium]